METPKKDQYGLELIQALKEQIEILKSTLKDKDEIIELLDKLREKELSSKTIAG